MSVPAVGGVTLVTALLVLRVLVPFRGAGSVSSVGDSDNGSSRGSKLRWRLVWHQGMVIGALCWGSYLLLLLPTLGLVSAHIVWLVSFKFQVEGQTEPIPKSNPNATQTQP